MNYAEFITAITDIYGSYQSEPLKRITIKYVIERFQESELESVFGQLIIKVNPKYKTPPSPADFEEIFFKKSTVDIEAKAKAAYAEICRYSTMYPAIFSDPRSQAAIEMMGGWAQFGCRNPEEEQIHRNTFCKYFKQFAESPTELIQRELPGSGNWYKPKPPQLIGDRDKCLMIAEGGKSQAITEIENMSEGFKKW
jgi:hypothetical protein